MRTISAIARPTAKTFAARVPGPLDGIAIDKAQRRSEPRTPPRETSQTAFRVKPTSL
jgi:hypothetical protein